VKKYLLDTNVLLRFLLDDHPELSRAAARLFQQAADEKCLLILADLCIAEAVWVLTSYYKIERQKVADSLAKLLLKAGSKFPAWSPYLTPWPASRRPIAIFSTAI
jgi:predicted nucleic-acid-binding protein